jgi:hypothetical protein
VIDVLTAVITAQGEFTMTTPNAGEQAVQAAPAKEPEATKTPNTAPKKPRVAPGKAKSGKKSTSAKKATKAAKAAKKESGPRKGSKTEKVLELLKRPNGAALAELMKATSWQAHSVRGFLSGTVGKKLGLTLTSTKGEGEDRTYSLKS